MTSIATLQPDPAPIVACTISRDVQNFEMLIDDMEEELGESWGDLSFDDALIFLDQPESARLRFVAIAVNAEDAADLSLISDVIRTAKLKKVAVILIADQVGPVELHKLLQLGADGFVPYPLPEGALHEAITKITKAAALAATAAAEAAEPVQAVWDGEEPVWAAEWDGQAPAAQAASEADGSRPSARSGRFGSCQMGP